MTYALVPTAATGMLLRGFSEFWEALPFVNLLLPVLVAAALIAHGVGKCQVETL